MKSFVGRKRELYELAAEYQTNRASLVVIKGRRRIGKTTLIEHFSQGKNFYKFTGLAPHVGMTAQTQRNEFCRKLEEFFQLFAIKNDDWATLFTVLAKQVADQHAIILFDKISWLADGDSTIKLILKKTFFLILLCLVYKHGIVF